MSAIAAARRIAPLIFAALPCWALAQATDPDDNPDPGGAAPQVTHSVVVATVDETPITLGELIVLRQSLPQQYQDLPDEVLAEALVRRIIDQQLLANAAVASGLRR